MKPWILLVLILTINIALAEDNLVYLLDLHYDNGEINLNEISLETGYNPDRKIQYGDYKLEVISFDYTTIYSFNFRAPRIYADKSDKIKGEIDGAVIDLDEADFTLVIPYFKDGKDIKIYKENNEIFSTDISEFSIRKSPKRNFTWLFVLIVLFVFVIIFIIKRKK